MEVSYLRLLALKTQELYLYKLIWNTDIVQNNFRIISIHRFIEGLAVFKFLWLRNVRIIRHSLQKSVNMAEFPEHEMEKPGPRFTSLLTTNHEDVPKRNSHLEVRYQSP